MSSDNQEAGFNMSLQSLKRMDSLLWKVSNASLNKDYETWDITLRTLRREISPYVKKKAFEDLSTKFKQLKNMKWLGLDDDGRKNVKEADIEAVEELLDTLTIDIQNALFDCGVLMKIKDDPTRSVVGN